MSQNSVSINEGPRLRAWDESAFNRSFYHEFARAGNVSIHYVIGSNGPLVTLLYGFPQNWRELRLVMPDLTAKLIGNMSCFVPLSHGSRAWHSLQQRGVCNLETTTF